MSAPFKQLLERYIRIKYNVVTEVHKEYRAHGFGPGLETDHYKFSFSINNDTLVFYQYGQNQRDAEKQIDEQAQLHLPEYFL